jgi:membrane-bound lytic murein transglycosylase B
LAAKASAAGSYAMQPAVREAADAIAQSHALSRSWVRATLAQAQMLPEVVRAVTPAPDPGVRNWQTYRNRMVEPVRVQAGVQFWLRNAKTLERAERETGVPASVIVGILGVETIYGKHMGKYRVLDALATLAFDFPASHPKAPAHQESWRAPTAPHDGLLGVFTFHPVSQAAQLQPMLFPQLWQR